MPVTARLSSKVYEKLGDEVVDQIVQWFNQVDSTYRAELREMNDLNFARFDAKMGERLAQFEVRLQTGLAALGQRIDGIEGRMGTLGTRQELAALEIRLTRRIYAVSITSFLAQIVALIAVVRFMVVR